MRPETSLPIVLVTLVIACDTPVTQPTDTTSPSSSIAAAVRQYWEVLAIAPPGAVASAINDSGVIVGTINEGFARPFRYSPGVITTYPATADSWMSASDINESGQVVGSTLVNGTVRAYVRHANGTVVLLPHSGPPGTTNYGYAINDLGEVAGMTNTNFVIFWRVAIGGWQVVAMGIMIDRPLVNIQDINNSGTIVGSAREAPGGDLAAFTWKGGSYQFLGTLGGNESSAKAINNSGKIIGTSDLASGEPRFFTWTSFGGMRDEAPTTDVGFWAAISDKGRIAGSSPINGFQRAFTMYKGVHTVLPLPPSGLESYVFDINSCGVIVGRMRMNDGSFRAVRWRRVVGSPPFPVCD
jgi:probable HAF family extracellular repeat protein